MNIVKQKENDVKPNPNNLNKTPGDAKDSKEKHYKKFDKHNVVADEPQKEEKDNTVTKSPVKASSSASLTYLTNIIAVILLGLLTPRFARCF